MLSSSRGIKRKEKKYAFIRQVNVASKIKQTEIEQLISM